MATHGRFELVTMIPPSSLSFRQYKSKLTNELARAINDWQINKKKKAKNEDLNAITTNKI